MKLEKSEVELFAEMRFIIKIVRFILHHSDRNVHLQTKHPSDLISKDIRTVLLCLH